MRRDSGKAGMRWGCQISSIVIDEKEIPSGKNKDGRPTCCKRYACVKPVKNHRCLCWELYASSYPLAPQQGICPDAHDTAIPYRIAWKPERNIGAFLDIHHLSAVL